MSDAFTVKQTRTIKYIYIVKSGIYENHRDNEVIDSIHETIGGALAKYREGVWVRNYQGESEPEDTVLWTNDGPDPGEGSDLWPKNIEKWELKP